MKKMKRDRVTCIKEARVEMLVMAECGDDGDG